VIDCGAFDVSLIGRVFAFIIQYSSKMVGA